MVPLLTAKTYNTESRGLEVEVVYNGDNPWDGTFVGWFIHDGKVGSKATAKWYTKYYCVTTYQLYDHIISSRALQVSDYGISGLRSPNCTDYGFLDTIHLFDKWVIVSWEM